MVLIEWKARNDTPFSGKVKDYVAQTRNIPDMVLFLNPTSEVVHDPMLMLNMDKAIERVRKAIKNNEEIAVTVDPDTDGCVAASIKYDYYKRKLGAKVNVVYHERQDGHGVQYDDIPESTDLLIILDSSSNEVGECKKLSESMDIIILDHHIVEEDNPYCTLVNPQQEGCNYPNKSMCTGLLALKFVEVLDYEYQKMDTHHYADLAGMSLLADSMDMRVMENRFFVYEGMKNIKNVGLLALINAKRKTPDKVDSTFLNFQIIPMINTATRNNEIHKALKILLQQDFNKAKKMAKIMVEDNDKRKETVKQLTEEYKSIMENEKLVYVVTKNATKNYNGLIAQKLASEFKKPALVLKDKGDTYEGSFRSYNDFDLLTFMKNCVYTTHSGGHSSAGGCGVKAEYWEKFKPYVEDGLSEVSFDPVIKYDIEIDESDLCDAFEEKPNFELVEQIQEIDYVSGKRSESLTIRINNIVPKERKLFGKDKHTSIIADNFTMKKFNDNEYAEEIDDWDVLDMIGSLSINEFGGNKDIQLIVEDYKLH